MALRYILCAVCAFAPSIALADSTGFGVDAEYLHDSNATRGPTSADEKSDNIFSVEAYAAQSSLATYSDVIVADPALRLLYLYRLR